MSAAEIATLPGMFLCGAVGGVVVWAALVQALEEVREVLADPSLPEYRVAWKRVYDVLERRMGADWLNGRGESE